MHYTYDFNYSVHLESMPKCSQLASDKQFSIATKQLLEADVFQNKETKQFLTLLSRQTIFMNLGQTLLELTAIELELVPKTLEKMERSDLLREQLCEYLKEINIVLGRQRQYYLNIIILIISLIVTCRLREKHEREIEKLIIFHFIHWEIKGQHSTNAFYQRITSDLLIQFKVQNYIQGLSQNNPLKESQTFKQLQTSLQLMKARQSTSGFALALSKENQNIHNKMMNTLSFKKQSGQGKQGNRKGGLFDRGNARK